MTDRADEIAREIADAHLAGNDSQIDAIVEDIAAALRSYAAAETAARDRSEDRARQSEAELVAMRDERDKLRKLDQEAATYVESVICMRTHFTGEPPYVGWKGLGLALNEMIDERDRLREALKPFANIGLGLAERTGIREEVRAARAALSSPTPEGGGG